MKVEFSHATPYIMFMFGCFISYIGWTTKKILENIEKSVSHTANKVEGHSTEIATINTTLGIHGNEIKNIRLDIDGFKKNGKI